MMKILFFLFFVDCYIITQQSPHILQDLQVCEISIPDGKKFKKMKVPSYIIAENPELNVMVSLCGQIPRVFPNDGTCRNSCVYNKRSKSLVTSASSFAVPYIVEDASNLEITLRLENVLKCTKDENYEIMVKMVSNPSLKKPRLNIMDTQCQLEIEMLKPDYQPPCTFLLDTKELIDFRALNRRIISVPWKGETFKIALCGSVRECGLEVAGCKVGNDTLVFGEIKTQQVRYDNINNHLKVVASVGKKLKMEVKVHCNWLVPYFANPKYMEPAQQGRTYKFEVESSFGCVKLPTNCIIHDAKNDMTYNLEGLSNKYGHRVKAVGSKYFLLNICGSLVTRGPQKNECDLEHSQACQVDGTSYINKGSIPSFEVKNKAIKVIISEGSRCNVNQTYSTEIEVVCSYIEKGPKFILEQNCVVKIMWETPKACPKFEKQSDSCELSTSFGGVNLKSLHGEDRNQNFPSATFKYNLCGNLFSNCSLYSNVTACYVNKNGGKEDVIGWNSPELSYKR
ncbi:hypothetical protein HHI36_022741 [Cryptolaemus montrouzieri]|uniref:MRH domain-containing protein n=1 Tax=Cryptolaemus montrouzieri TaxID=559131 RepID=A0ABD2N0T4_9CUCU